MYSNRDLTGYNLSAENMDGMTIENSCLSDATLPPTLIGATFIDCNMDNVIVPEGNTMVRCSNRMIAVQNDVDDWIVDPITREPIEPVNKKYREQVGLNINPSKIPPYFMRRETILQKEYQRDKGGEVFQSWFLEDPAITNTTIREIAIEGNEETIQQMAGDYYPFDAMPTVQINSDGVAILVGGATFVTIEGKGLIRGGIGLRTFDNTIFDYPAEAQP